MEVIIFASFMGMISLESYILKWSFTENDGHSNDHIRVANTRWYYSICSCLFVKYAFRLWIL